MCEGALNRKASETFLTPHLLSTFRETRVASDPPFNVKVTLSVPAQVDGAWCDVNVHEVIHDSALDVILDSVHQIPPAHVDDLYEGQLSLKKKKKRDSNQMRKGHWLFF